MKLRWAHIQFKTTFSTNQGAAGAPRYPGYETVKELQMFDAKKKKWVPVPAVKVDSVKGNLNDHTG